MATLSDIIATQDDLVKEASLALPHSFSQCTHSLGSIRQAVYLCKTCAVPRGICSACSIACHTDHEQLELFPKRNFRCDCPTSAIPHTCTLHVAPEGENVSNSYGHNFSGVFCRCGRPYDATTEQETMIQCLSCEDWFHESCLNLRTNPLSEEPSPAIPCHSIPSAVPHPDDDTASETSSNGLPPPLISAAGYDSFVCGACVRRIDTLKRWAGTPGVLMVVKDDPSNVWKVIDESKSLKLENGAGDSVDVVNESQAITGSKRSRSSSPTDAPDAKKIRPSSPSKACLAPPVNPRAQQILAPSKELDSSNESLGTGDIFLTEGWRERWCKCPSCLPSLESHPYLLEEEETYEPPEDPDSGLSLEELGMRALQNLPRDRAIDGIRAFNSMRDDLLNYLRPFAREGKVVDEAAVRTFFESLEEKRQSNL